VNVGAAPKPGMPRPVRVVATLAEFLAGYGILMAQTGILIGLFVGQHILIPSLVQGALGVSLLFMGKGVLKRIRWSRWSLVGLSFFAAVGLAAAIIREAILGSIDVASGVIVLGLSITSGLIAVLLLSSSARIWFGS
jgi:hypothetical protein